MRIIIGLFNYFVKKKKDIQQGKISKEWRGALDVFCSSQHVTIHIRIS